ncbi:basic amino acid/polyamine antiporter, APA family [Lentzea fradiae]|uniref:Basic amino acid/polyamine antiporter, APA family n=1 Tax=Lentzea fradiae TaxID=200378 RepID=A0A1G8BUV5_9PSEU|nr:APC family permease [Lentzea fradiae]SDH36500.1 basic amino acid/polyamine antiporter, APA family [Lentzea fradiae]
MQPARSLTLTDAVFVGLGSMIGAGVFAVFAPAAAAAGSALLVSLVVAGVVACCNALSSAWLAARYPQSGGTYVYGRERLGRVWGDLAGWAFVLGKTASCAAMALTVGTYAGFPTTGAVAAIVALTVLNLTGVRKSALATRVIVVVVLLVLGTTAITAATAREAVQPAEFLPAGILPAAALLFFAFAGYARIATLGEEVREPERTIPRAVVISLAITLVVYAVVAVVALRALGSDLASSTLADVSPALAPVLRVAACLAALGSLLSLQLGVSRTALAMARDRRLPGPLADLRVAEVCTGLAAVALVLSVDVTRAIVFSSFCVLLYYAIANASAWTLGKRIVPAVGLIGCLVLAGAVLWQL